MEYTDERILEALLRWRDNRPEQGMDVAVDMAARTADSIVVGSLIGQRVRLVFMDRKNAPHEPGDEGTVFSVDYDGTVRVRWDRAPSHFHPLVPDRDRWEWLGAPPRLWFPDEVILETLLRTKNDDESSRAFDDDVREPPRSTRPAGLHRRRAHPPLAWRRGLGEQRRRRRDGPRLLGPAHRALRAAPGHRPVGVALTFLSFD